MATTIRIESQHVTISSDLRPFQGRKWSGSVEEALSAWVGRKFTKYDSRHILRRDILNARGSFTPGVRQTIIE